jgi:plastocyanin
LPGCRSVCEAVGFRIPFVTATKTQVVESVDGSAPDIPNAKGNSTFCVNTGTTIVWKSTQKNMGFVVDFGPSSPFGFEDAIVGGARHSVSVTAMEPGCYKYSAGACISGAPGNVRFRDGGAIIIATGSP